MRMIAMVGVALAEGFGLLGCETYANATPQELEDVLSELLRGNEKVLLFLEHGLARAAGTSLERVRKEGGQILVTEVPPLHAPEDYQPPVEELVRRVLGPSALEERP